ncbi:hypothetical protein BDR04DRAFT_1115357 [Suillus decipiens]|nr:hypothetical protein BDR04DRAFT_1115357 [Suillus decipiens]
MFASLLPFCNGDLNPATPYLPTEDQLEAMEKFINSMDIMGEKDDKGQLLNRNPLYLMVTCLGAIRCVHSIISSIHFMESHDVNEALSEDINPADPYPVSLDNITNRAKLSCLLEAEHGITVR